MPLNHLPAQSQRFVSAKAGKNTKSHKKYLNTTRRVGIDGKKFREILCFSVFVAKNREH